MASWPLSSASLPFVIPEELTKIYSQFQTFYQKKHSGRKLNWLFNVSKADVKTNYLKQTYTFQVSTYQMAVLLLFNSKDSHTMAELVTGTGLTEPALAGQIAILVKAKILLSEDDCFSINMGFKK